MESKSKIYFSIIIPVYNEIKNIQSTVDGIERAFNEVNKEYEILFIDDNSQDGTDNEIVRISKLNNRVKLKQHGKKEGLGAASDFGYKHATGEIIMQLDGDLAHNPNDLVLMYKFMIENNYDMVIGSRYIKHGRQEGKTILRDIGSRLMNLIAGILLNIKLKDFTHTFRVFRLELYKSIRHNLIEKGHPSYFIELTYFSLKKNFRVSEFPVTYSDKDDGADSKIPIIKESIRYTSAIIRIFFGRLFK